MICLEIPLKTVNGLNRREHWAVAASRAKKERQTTRLCVRCAIRPISGDLNGHYKITLTRFGKRKMDGDGVQASFKHVRDGIADALGINDGDDRLEWVYAQCSSKKYYISINILRKDMP